MEINPNRNTYPPPSTFSALFPLGDGTNVFLMFNPSVTIVPLSTKKTQNFLLHHA